MRYAARATRVLLIEDNPADVYLVRLFLDRLGAALELQVATDGEQALELLAVSAHDPSLLPELILLDLNLPKVDGWELLRRVKTDARLATIPVVVLSSARSEAEVASCYRLHANAFVSKREEPHEMERSLKSLSEFWFNTVQLPRC